LGDEAIADWSPFPPRTLLSRCDAATRAELLGLGVRRTVPAGTVLLREGDVESHVILLLDALVKISGRMADGRQALLSIRVSGDLIGEIAALTDTPRSATATTCVRSAFTVIARRDLRPFLHEHPEVAVEVAAIIGGKLRRATRLRVDFASYPVRVRLARVLVEIAEQYGTRAASGIVIGVPLTQPELAGLCGAAEVSLQKAIRELRRADLIDTGYRRIIVLDFPALRRVADIENGHHPL
jgi:CRP-like cAMP-binding protein